ncbi:MAG TPA: hypothetical protein VK985_08890 [Rariglobus sp.]|nr:hypothetical protein [Rariglobus sp.]
MTFKFRIYFSLLACVFSVARAQVPETVKVELSAVTWGVGLTGIFYRSAGKPVPLPVPALNAGVPPALTYSGPPQLELLRKVTSPDGVAAYVPAGIVQLDTTHRRFLVLFTPPPMESGQPKVLSNIALPNDDALFAKGQMRLANCTPVPVAVKCNQQVLELPVGASRVISPGGAMVMLEIAVHDGTEWKLIANNFLTIAPETRLNTFIYLGGRLGESSPRVDSGQTALTARDFAVLTLPDKAAP